MNKKKNNKGFSLIELIIAIAILIILTGLLAPQFMKYIEKSREAKDMQTLDTVYTAVQGALADEAAYKDFVNTESADKALYAKAADGVPLSELIADAADGAVSTELKSLLGSKTFSLASKKAEGGTVCVRIEFTKSSTTVDGVDLDVEGLEVTVYSGSDDGKNTVGSLDAVGNNPPTKSVTP